MATLSVPPAPRTAPPPSLITTSTTHLDDGNKPKYEKIRNVQHAEVIGAEIVCSLRNPNIRFPKKRTTRPESEYSDEYRNQLFLDAKALELAIAKKRLAVMEGKAERKSLAPRLSYDLARLCAHYGCSESTAKRIIRRGEREVSTGAKPRPGRKKKETPPPKKSRTAKKLTPGSMGVMSTATTSGPSHYHQTLMMTHQQPHHHPLSMTGVPAPPPAPKY